MARYTNTLLLVLFNLIYFTLLVRNGLNTLSIQSISISKEKRYAKVVERNHHIP